jgi:ATP-dependent HslUV protease ATP-binding subunit HslU
MLNKSNIKNGISLTPREIVLELDRCIIGQSDAKKAVASALRNRWRRKQIKGKLKDEIMPKNIIMIGPTGCGKTEIARRLAKLSDSPFVKVEATKFTEVGYVGRDVDSMIRDLMESSLVICKKKAMYIVLKKAERIAEERILDLLLPRSNKKEKEEKISKRKEVNEKDFLNNRNKIKNMLKEGKLKNKEVTVNIATSKSDIPVMHMLGSSAGIDDMASGLQDMIYSAFGGKKFKKKKMLIEDAKKIIALQEAEKLIDNDQIKKDAIGKSEEFGIIFIDEIDKIVSRKNSNGPDVSREGVQRDILPIVEGSSVQTKYGSIKTDHILFIAAGVFHSEKPSELIPELQGRFPIKVELNSLSEDDFVKILLDTENSLIKQYTALMKTEKIILLFKKNAIMELAKIAALINRRQRNIGARRLYTIMEKLFEEENFCAPEKKGRNIVVDSKYVSNKLKFLLIEESLDKFII